MPCRMLCGTLTLRAQKIKIDGSGGKYSVKASHGRQRLSQNRMAGTALGTKSVPPYSFQKADPGCGKGRALAEDGPSRAIGGHDIDVEPAQAAATGQIEGRLGRYAGLGDEPGLGVAVRGSSGSDPGFAKSHREGRVSRLREGRRHRAAREPGADR